MTSGSLSQEEIDALLKSSGRTGDDPSAASDRGEGGATASQTDADASGSQGQSAGARGQSGDARQGASAEGAGGGDTGSQRGDEAEGASTWPPPPVPPPSEDELDVLAEVANISMGSAATAASELVQRKVVITAPTTELSTPQDVWAQFELPTVVVEVGFVEGLKGRSLFILRPRDAAVIADLMMGNDGTNPPETLDDLALSAVAEAMNQMMGSSATAMSDFFSLKVNISPPEARLTDAGDRSPLASDEPMVAVSFWLRIEDLIDSNFVQLMPFPFAMELIRMAKRAVGAENGDVEGAAQPAPGEPASPDAAAARVGATPAGAEPAGAAYDPEDGGEPETAGQAAASGPVDLLAELSKPEPPRRTEPPRRPEPQSEVKEHGGFPSFDEPAAAGPSQPASHPLHNVSLELIRHIPVEVGATLGHAEMSVKDVLRLTTGALVQLNTQERDLVSIHANGVEIARGEVVVVGEKYGVRITDIVDPARRLSSLQR